MATGHNRLGATATYTTLPAPPGIVEKATKDWRFYQQAIISSEERTGELLREYKEGGTWKQHYKTWTDACVPLNISRSQSNRLIAESVAISAECANDSNKQDEKALKKVEKARERPGEEEPEKSRVKTATEVIAENAEKNGHVEPKPASKTKPPTDKSGCIIPQKLLELYERREELTKPMHYIAQVRTALEKLQTEKDVLYMSIVHNGIIQTTAKCAESLYHALRECQPEIVCPECDGGQNSKSIRCNECGGSGMISEEKYNRSWIKSTRPERLAVVKGRMANK